MKIYRPDRLYSRLFLLLFSILLTGLAEWLFHSNIIRVDKEDIAGRIESVIEKQDQLARELINETKKLLTENPDIHFLPASSLLLQRSDDDPLSLLVFKNNELTLWSDNRVPFEYRDSLLFSTPVTRLKNGWYRILLEEFEEYSIIALTRIKHEYAHRNRYLSNNFIPSFNLPESAQIATWSAEGSIDIKDSSGRYLFSVLLENKDTLPDSALWIFTLVTIIGLCLLILFLHKEFTRLEKYAGKSAAAILFVTLLAALRYWSLSVEFPSVFYEFDLFKPERFGASFLLPSLGDFLINTLLVLYIFYFLASKSVSFPFAKKENSTGGLLLIFFITGIIYLYAHVISKLLRILIEDSNIEFNINNIFNLSLYSFVGFVIIGLLFFSFYLFCEFLFRVSQRLRINKNYFFLIWITVIALAFLFEKWRGVDDPVLILWPTIVLLILTFAFYVRQERISFNYTVLLLIIFSGFAAHTLTRYTYSKEQKNRLVLAGEKLLTDEDPLVEIQFSEMESELQSSELLHNAFDSVLLFSKEEFEERMEKEFFKDAWNKFDIRFYLFAADSLPVGLEGFAPIRDFAELNRIIHLHGMRSRYTRNMFYIYNSSDKLSYVIRLTVKNKDNSVKGYLFCELRSKKVPENIGFPELLIDRNSNTIDIIHNYSFARYVDSVQVNHFGTFRYSLNSSPYEDFEGKYEFRSEKGYSHLLYRVDRRTLLILSKPLEKFISQATTFSYLFTLFCLILVLGFIIRQISLGNATLQLSMRGKVQIMLGGILLISLVLFGLGTRYFIADQYQEKNYNIISEKIHSVRIEVSGKLGTEEELGDELKNYISYILSRFSNVFLTDINIFGPEGKLIATSRPKIYQSGLIAPYMDPEAYRRMKYENKSEFIQEEKIGNMRFLSAYVPLMNEDNKIIGYLNLPYFSRQNALESELSSFLVAILNIFVVLFALSLLAALFVSNWITKPLRLIQQSLAGIQLGKSNKPIEYTGKDEIGSLVEEYNKKVAELEMYATELARSERESAWREMAKQVAHEIKNPLTPMRLSIQHMQRSLRPDDPEWEEKLNKISTTLIEQIDTLSNIANEFSNFAKMPKAKEEKLNLTSILEHITELYKETPNVKISIHPGEKNAFIIADKDQLIRVFNNLIKNAIQSIPDERQGEIDVFLRKQSGKFIIEIRDNGSGIPYESIPKIFAPNFTTKSTGMGLGLAMVKNIIESIGGRIWFETEEGTGTRFFVEISEADS